MAKLTGASLNTPAETRDFDKGHADIVEVGGTTVGRFTFQPGWKWSESVKPIAKTDLCESHHLGVVTGGKLHVELAGDSIDVSAGDVYEIPPGHDAWVVGDEDFVGYEFKSAGEYAKPE
jgi:mannose-6-phosphate isomerase-like protein (cupin superfamily)